MAEKRIKTRGRETNHRLTERLIRMQEKIEMPTPDKIIHNDGDLDKAVTELISYLKTLYLKIKQNKSII